MHSGGRFFFFHRIHGVSGKGGSGFVSSFLPYSSSSSSSLSSDTQLISSSGMAGSGLRRPSDTSEPLLMARVSALAPALLSTTATFVFWRIAATGSTDVVMAATDVVMAAADVVMAATDVVMAAWVHTQSYILYNGQGYFWLPAFHSSVSVSNWSNIQLPGKIFWSYYVGHGF
jgi:hypothetical protein